MGLNYGHKRKILAKINERKMQKKQASQKQLSPDEQVFEFLKSIDLVQLKDKFFENRLIDLNSILDTSEQFLDKMRVGHKNKTKIIKRINEIRKEQGKKPKRTPDEEVMDFLESVNLA